MKNIKFELKLATKLYYTNFITTAIIFIMATIAGKEILHITSDLICVVWYVVIMYIPVKDTIEAFKRCSELESELEKKEEIKAIEE